VRLCVDEDLASRELVNRLRRAGHHIATLRKGLPDEDVWREAQRLEASVLTMNASDFLTLSSSGGHAGLLIVFAEGDRTRDMKPADIADAVDRIDARHPDGLRNFIGIVNHYRS